jgi:hypothetical protein
MGVTELFAEFLTCFCPIGHKIRPKILWVVVGFVTIGADKSHTLLRSVNEILSVLTKCIIQFGRSPV